MQTLHVEQLAIDRGDRGVLRDLRFSVESGEIVHVTGRNGAGKTTLLETLCGLRAPRSGRIDGMPNATARHWIGHRNGLSPALSPLENLRFWAGLEGLALSEADAADALRQLGLQAQRHRPVGGLSTGQKRRAALARLTAVTRPWWFLDEPLAGLDAAGLSVFAGLLASHVGRGGAAVVTSHQPLPGDPAGLRTLALTA
jgi:heme exporter protein A